MLCGFAHEGEAACLVYVDVGIMRADGKVRAIRTELSDFDPLEGIL